MKINRDVPQTLADRNNFERMLNNTENLYNTNNNTDFIYVRNNSIYNSFINSPNNTSDESNLIISNIIVENSELLNKLKTSPFIMYEKNKSPKIFKLGTPGIIDELTRRGLQEPIKIYNCDYFKEPKYIRTYDFIKIN